MVVNSQSFSFFFLISVNILKVVLMCLCMSKITPAVLMSSMNEQGFRID